ncbi:LuxR C-terminal-related transcriptional regulator [Emcibacter nanhaiensis]|uniref:HTH luxR-type domain-containing protein n=1 Tax=Emcibacter nanhaiensis TaxID=1505037 RepID=A0A501PG26_9PROT|nr:LuxR C-terminal-related transcriptional regulator [Emcibacter nanhaiensis]TPD58997.1 hypothetical protein FIV46_12230 [Emcibacter nanhaiensis]
MKQNNHYKHWLLQATISPPKRHEDMLRRQDLLDCFDNIPEGGTVIVTAPPGYGKTLLLSDWCQTLKNRGEYCAWLHLDESDDVEMVLTHAAYAFHLQGIDFSDAGLLEEENSREFEPIRALKTLLAKLERQEGKVTIIFDDMERASEDVIKNFFAYFLRWSPKKLTIVFSSRIYPPLDFGDLALRSMLTEIGPKDLQFTAEEIAELVGKKSQLDLDFIARESRGWPALVQLMRIALAEKENPPRDSTGKTLSEVFKTYLDKIILTSITEQQLNALLEASIFKAIPVAYFKRKITRGEMAPRVLNDLYRLPEFIASVENDASLLLMHPLLRDRLEKRLNEESPNRASALHTDAALWFVEQGQELMALYHASLTGSLGLVEDILFKIGGPAWVLFQPQSHLRRVNELILKSRKNAGYKKEIALLPLATLTDIISETKIGHLDKARKTYNLLVSQWNELKDQTEKSLSETQLTDFSISLARISLDYYSLLPIDKTSARLLVSYEHSEIASTPYLQATIWNTDALLANEQSDFLRAISSAQRAIGKFRASFSSNGEVHVLLLKAGAEIALGQTKSATDSISTAGNNIKDSLQSNQELQFAYNVSANELELQLSPYQFEKIDKLTAYIFEKEAKLNLWFDYYASAILQVVDRYYLDEKLKEAREFIDSCLTIANKRNLERLSYFLQILQAYVLVKSGDEQQAINCISGSINHQSPHAFFGWRELEIISELTILLDLEKINHAEPAKEVMKKAVDSGNKRLQLRLLFASAEQLWRNNQQDHALTALTTACSLIKETGYLREAALNYDFLHTVKDSYEAFCQDESVRTNQGTNLTEILEKLDNDKAALANRLTLKEIQIATELINGNSDKVIARHLNISPNTVRFHLKNIFRKLNVTTRQKAVEKILLENEDKRDILKKYSS